MIFVNHELTKISDDKLAILKKEFPSFFEKGDKFRPVVIHNNLGFFFDARRGRTPNTLKSIRRPNAGKRISMRVNYIEDYQTNLIVVSTAHPIIDRHGNRDYRKGAGVFVEHGTMLTFDQLDTLMFLYFYSPHFSNGASEHKSGQPQFYFSMPEKDQNNRLEEAKTNARIMGAITTGLDHTMVKDILRKFGVLSVDEPSDRDALLSRYTSKDKSRLIEYIDSVLEIVSEKGESSVVDVQSVVNAAIESGRIAITEGKLFVLKPDGTMPTNATKKLTSVEADEQLLEVVSFFTDNESKLKQIL